MTVCKTRDDSVHIVDDGVQDTCAFLHAVIFLAIGAAAGPWITTPTVSSFSITAYLYTSCATLAGVAQCVPYNFTSMDPPVRLRLAASIGCLAVSVVLNFMSACMGAAVCCCSGGQVASRCNRGARIALTVTSLTFGVAGTATAANTQFFSAISYFAAIPTFSRGFLALFASLPGLGLSTNPNITFAETDAAVTAELVRVVSQASLTGGLTANSLLSSSGGLLGWAPGYGCAVANVVFLSITMLFLALEGCEFSKLSFLAARGAHLGAGSSAPTSDRVVVVASPLNSAGAQLGAAVHAGAYGQQPAPSNAPSLPPGWSRHEDEAAGDVWYHNAGTGETQWEHPGGV